MKIKKLFLLVTTFMTISCIGSSHDCKNKEPMDFSAVWTSYQELVYGYVGENYQRFYFLIDSIKMSEKDTLLYDVWGKYRVKDQISNYVGQIRVREDIAMLSKEYQVDEEPLPQNGTQIYGITSEWNLKANNSDEQIKGEMISTFFLRNGQAVFNDIGLGWSDPYCNNQFMGTFYSKKYGEQKCRWGTCRIPDSDDLDIGSAGFSPDEKYSDFGWQSYINAFLEGTDEGWKAEKQSRWTLRPDTLQLKFPAIINDPDGYVNVRKEPNKNSEIVAKISTNEIFFFTLMPETDWYPVYFQKSTLSVGYIHKSRIKTVEGFPEGLIEKVRRLRIQGT